MPACWCYFEAETRVGGGPWYLRRNGTPRAYPRGPLGARSLQNWAVKIHKGLVDTTQCFAVEKIARGKNGGMNTKQAAFPLTKEISTNIGAGVNCSKGKCSMVYGGSHARREKWAHRRSGFPHCACSLASSFLVSGVFELRNAYCFCFLFSLLHPPGFSWPLPVHIFAYP
jgi:hypothetical protein